MGCVPDWNDATNDCAKKNGGEVVGNDAEEIERQKDRSHNQQKVSEGIVDHYHEPEYHIHRSQCGDDHKREPASKGCRRALAANDKGTDGSKVSKWDTEGHYEYHVEGCCDHDAPDHPGASRIG